MLFIFFHVRTCLADTDQQIEEEPYVQITVEKWV